MEQRNITTPAAFYLYSRELVELLPYPQLGADDMCDCVAELERETSHIDYEQWKRDHRVL